MTESSHQRMGERRAFAVFLASLAATVALTFGGIFMGLSFRNADLIGDAVVARGRSLFEEIVLARRWNAGYGGVYVKKVPGVESNPWLADPDIAAADGTILTLRNPAVMTREISDIAARAAGFSLRITSLKPLNPENAPDGFERIALERFEGGQTEYWETVDSPDGREFRFMGALVADESCLECHAAQGYAAGDVRGGISVSFPVESVRRELAKTGWLIGLAAALTLAATLALVYSFVLRLKKKLDKARTELETAAVTDALTGLYNRRYGMDRFRREVEKTARLDLPLSCALVDADDFKRLNDTYGHLAGDAALKAVAACLRDGMRPYDIALRYGGEEFLLILPGVRAEESLQACERLRSLISERAGATLPAGARLTVSVGIAAFYPESAGRPGPAETAAIVEELLSRSDAAMYAAKYAGKDRCMLG